jgi:hypothetical protein
MTVATTAMAILGEWPTFWPAELLDDADLVLAVQFYLRSRRARLPTTPALERIWEWFAGTYSCIVKRAVRKSCRSKVSGADFEDFEQEVWWEILNELPDMIYDPVCGDLSSLLDGLVQQKTHRLLVAWARRRRRQCVAAVRNLAESSRARGLGPADVCYVREIGAQVNAVLVELHRRTSPQSFDAFRWRFFGRQRVREIAAALDLGCNEVRCRCYQLRRQWQALAKRLGSLDVVVDLLSSRQSRLPRKPR